MDADPHDEIVRLEAQIEALADKIESCRKFILGAYVAMGAGGVILVAMLFGVILPDLTWMAGGMAAVLGGIVAFGSNNSTAKEAQAEIAAAETRRAELIAMIDLRVVSERPTLH